jgi:DGQHR domain-containing protein
MCVPTPAFEPIPAIKISQYDTDIYMTSFSAQFLMELHRQRYLNVEEYQIGEDESYQRFEDKKRVRELADFLINYRGDQLVKPILPASIVINVRDSRDINFENGLLTIKRNAKLNIVDGQHRAKGLIEAQSRGENLNYEIPVSFVTNLERFQEAAQFLMINVKQKPVRTDLALTVLHELEQERTSEFVEKLKKALKYDAWQLTATAIAIALNNDRDSPWHDMIIRPNEDRRHLREAGRIWTPIRQASFVDTLRRFSETQYPDMNSKIVFLKRFWRNVKNVYPSPFEVDVGKNYVLLKGSGVGAMHILASLTYSLDKERIITVEEALRKLKQAKNVDFWERQGQGAGRWGTSQAELASNAKILAKLIAPGLFDLFDENQLKKYVTNDVLEEDDTIVQLVRRLFNPFNLEPIEGMDPERSPTANTTGCYMLVSGTIGRLRAYVGQSIHVQDRIADHSRPVKLYSLVDLKPEELNDFESLSYHLVKPSFRLNDDHPPLSPCPFCPSD